MGKNIDKRVWGVLGKQQTYFSPQKQVEGKTKTPLNANAFDSWDSTRSKFRRVDGYENAIQQGGTVIGQQTTPVVSPTPDVSPSPTPSFTPTQTQTNTPTPSSTPYILPETPALWYDATNVGSIDYISSGGTNYVSTWRSIGTYQKALSGATTDTMPVWSGSTKLPGSPLIIRFNKSTTTGLRDYLSQRFDSVPIPNSGATLFYVITNPDYLYSTNLLSASGFGMNYEIYSGNTTNGGFTPITTLAVPPNRILQFFNNTLGTVNANLSISATTFGNSFTNLSATTLGDKFLYQQIFPYPTGNPTFEINQSGGTQTTPITGGTSTGYNSVILNASVSSGGTITAANAGVEVAEIMFFNRVLTPTEATQVQNYLRDKWRYDEWATPVPTPTPTDTPNPTSTPSSTPTNTPTNTQTSTPTNTPTPSSTPPVFSPSGLTDLQFWFISTSGASASSWTNYGLLGGSLGQGTGSQQPQIVSSTLGSYTGNTVQYTSRDWMTGTFASTNYSSSTVFTVMKLNTTTGSGWSIDLYSSGTNNVAWSWQSFNTSSTSITRKNPGQSISPVRTIAPLLLATSGTSGSFSTASYNDALGTSGTTNYTGTTATILNFGYDPSVSTSNNLEVFEYLMYNRVLTTTEYANVMNYLKTKYQYNTW